MSQENELLHTFLKKAFHYHQITYERIVSLIEGDVRPAEDCLGIAALAIIRNYFIDVRLDGIIAATFNLLTYFTRASEYSNFDLWFMDYEKARKDYQKTYGTVNEEVLLLCNVYLTLQVISKRDADLARLLKLQRMQWGCRSMTDIAGSP